MTRIGFFRARTIFVMAILAALAIPGLGQRELPLRGRTGATGPDETRILLLTEADVLGLGEGTLTAARTFDTTRRGSILRSFQFQKLVRGILIEDAILTVIADGSGRIVAAESDLPAADPVGALRISEAAAVAATLEHVGGASPVNGAAIARSLVWRTAVGGKQFDPPRLFWRMHVRAGGMGPDGRPLMRLVYVDAEAQHAAVTGDALLAADAGTKVRHVTNHIPPDDPAVATAVIGQAGVEVEYYCAGTGLSMGPPVNSGPGGLITVPGAGSCLDGLGNPSVINIAARYGTAAFPFLTLYNGCGPLVQIEPVPFCGTTGGNPIPPAPYTHFFAGGASFPFGPLFEPTLGDGGPADLAGANTIHWHTVLRDWLDSHPAILAGTRITAEANLGPFGSVGWAFVDDTGANRLWRVQFAGPGPIGGGVTLANAASSTLILHEMGHIACWRATAETLWGTSDFASINEAVADTFAMYITGQPYIGINWAGPGSGVIRNGSGVFSYGNLDPETGDAHDNGEILMGAFWRLRQNLVSTLGLAAGDAEAKSLFLNWLTLYDDVRLDSRILAHLLILDDDDNNLANGTPHATAIVDAFAMHGWPAAVAGLWGTGPNPILGAAFFDPLAAGPFTGRMSKISLFVQETSKAPGRAILVFLGAPGSSFVPGLGTVLFDWTLPFFTILNGLDPTTALVPIPAVTGAGGTFDLRLDISGLGYAWPGGYMAALQGLVADPLAPPYLFRLTNGLSIALP